MAVIYNVKNARVDSKTGQVLRKKYDGGSPISLGFGLFLGADDLDKDNNAKAYFLMSTLAPGTADILHPSFIRSFPRLKDIPLDTFDFSKKFTVSDLLLETLSPGLEYWFAYTSSATSATIDSKLITYEKLDLLCTSDKAGPTGVKELLDSLKFFGHSQPT